MFGHAPIVSIIWLIAAQNFTIAYYINPNLPNDDLYKPGDVLFGALSPIYKIVPGQLCTPSKISYSRLQVIRAMVFTIDKINADSQVLPNITIGYAITNDCERESVAVAKSTKFIFDRKLDTCSAAQNITGNRPIYDVVAFVAPSSSAMAVPVSSLISLYQIPHTSWSASSQELSDKARFEYFSRVIPPDQFQAKVMMSIVLHFGWTYISTLNSEGSYGSNGIGAIEQQAKLNDICIAYRKELKFDETSEDFDNLIQQLRKNRKAKVIVMFIADQHVTAFFLALERNHAIGEFIFIGGDAFSPEKHFFSSAINSFGVAWSIEGRSQEFEDYYLSQDPWWNSTGNPWFGEFRDVDIGCSWSVQKDDKNSCHQYKQMRDIPGFTLSEWYTLMIDAMTVFSLGLHDLITENCPKAFSQKSLLQECIKGPMYKDYLMKVKFQGVSGWVEFDENGDALGNYKVMHYYKTETGKYDSRPVATWSRRDEKLRIQEQLIQWHEYKLVLEDDASLDNGDGMDLILKTVKDVPVSICAVPCEVGQFYIMGELKCCWECRWCRSNERVREDIQGCVTCPQTTWPDQSNFTTCLDIPPTYLLWTDPITLGIVGLTSLGILVTLVITFIFIKHRQKKVIKGSNIELMTLVIIGLFLAYITTFFYIIKPVAWACYASYYGFHISCTFIFGPLYLKCCRMKRIFDASKKCLTELKFIGSTFQIMFFFVILIIQIGISVGMAIISPPEALIEMPVPTEEYVELHCDLPLYNLIIPVSYNLFLLLLCAIYGFLTRALPENFNESWYIFISVTTTIFVWIAFLPTYLVAFYAYHKAALMALALILNSGVTTLCLFAPKLYALFFVSETNIKISNFDFQEAPAAPAK